MLTSYKLHLLVHVNLRGNNRSTNICNFTETSHPTPNRLLPRQNTETQETHRPLTVTNSANSWQSGELQKREYTETIGVLRVNIPACKRPARFELCERKFTPSSVHKKGDPHVLDAWRENSSHDWSSHMTGHGWSDNPRVVLSSLYSAYVDYLLWQAGMRVTKGWSTLIKLIKVKVFLFPLKVFYTSKIRCLFFKRILINEEIKIVFVWEGEGANLLLGWPMYRQIRDACDRTSNAEKCSYERKSTSEIYVCDVQAVVDDVWLRRLPLCMKRYDSL